MAKPPIRVVAYAPYTRRLMTVSGPTRPLRDVLRDNDDITQRCTALITRLQAAHDFLNAQYPTDPPDTLRLFLAPEWYFRRYLSAYTMREVVEAITMLRQESQALPNFIIIPGSFYWGVFKESGGFLAYRKVDVFNTAPVIHNGVLYCLYHKRQQLDIDHPRERFETWGMDAADAQIRFDELAHELAAFAPPGSAIDMTGRFTIGELTLALEICGDHSSKRLRDQASQDDLVDLHVVISCGMDLKPNTLICRRSGYAALCDGSLAVPDENYHAAAKLRQCTNLEAMQFGGNWLARLSPASTKTPHVLAGLDDTPANRLVTFDDLLEFPEPRPMVESFSQLRSAMEPATPGPST